MGTGYAKWIGLLAVFMLAAYFAMPFCDAQAVSRVNAQSNANVNEFHIVGAQPAAKTPSHSARGHATRSRASSNAAVNEAPECTVSFTKMVIPDPNGRPITYNPAEAPVLTWEELKRATVYVTSSCKVRKLTYDLWVMQPFAEFGVVRDEVRFFLRRHPADLSTVATADYDLGNGISADSALFDSSKQTAVQKAGSDSGFFWITAEICRLSTACQGHWNDTAGWKLNIGGTGKDGTGPVIPPGAQPAITNPYISKVVATDNSGKAVQSAEFTEAQRDKKFEMKSGSSFALTIKKLNKGKPLFLFAEACPADLSTATAAMDSTSTAFFGYKEGAAITGTELTTQQIPVRAWEQFNGKTMNACQYVDSALKQDAVTIAISDVRPDCATVIECLALIDKEFVWDVFVQPPAIYNYLKGAS